MLHLQKAVLKPVAYGALTQLYAGTMTFDADNGSYMAPPA